jgi:hypothetical protein
MTMKTMTRSVGAKSLGAKNLGARSLGLSVVLTGLSLGSLGLAADNGDPGHVYAGRAAVYRELQPESLEDLSTPDAIKSVSMENVAPTRIWRILEHGERVECLDCIPQVAKLLYAGNAKTREIGAWWLRRRIFGVFGPGEVYSQVVSALGDPTVPEGQRAYAAEALGEFLTYDGLQPLADAAVGDESPRVRLSAVNALARMGHEGPHGELAVALGDADESVRLGALNAAVGLHTFTGIDAVVACLADTSATVRARAAQVIGTIHQGAADASLVDALVKLTSPDHESDAGVRRAAVAALGALGADALGGADAAAKSAVQAAQNDPDSTVRDAARIALRRL